ncbi:Wadjet anti-phage system protein JetD domain-containing protein [Streptomyces cyaneochromogenes]|uniref:Wadjet anti-phage system protein JetD domain-containing protein n=1 Tax=Streptomyces cyaneochromogenes TaxID=2496836 RepID=UPI00225E5074|nr:Wadjet anti-phage system protein JetD domain-containing protein [Streptomyces cyaneochromogenes]
MDDLHAHGVRIIGNLADRIGRPVTPVAMTADLYRASTKYHQEPAKPEENRKLAARLAHQGIEALRDLADEIARTGGRGCEQETLYDEVLPTLPGLLKALHLPGSC